MRCLSQPKHRVGRLNSLLRCGYRPLWRSSRPEGVVTHPAALSQEKPTARVAVGTRGLEKPGSRRVDTAPSRIESHSCLTCLCGVDGSTGSLSCFRGSAQHRLRTLLFPSRATAEPAATRVAAPAVRLNTGHPTTVEEKGKGNDTTPDRQERGQGERV